MLMMASKVNLTRSKMRQVTYVVKYANGSRHIVAFAERAVTFAPATIAAF
jgi:hypothetical protein